MSNSFIQYAYVSGELSPTLYSRTDLEKYDLGLALARNWIVDYRGGITTRPGSEFREWLQYPNSKIRWFPFEFSPSVANTNIVVFGNGYIRFLQEGRYVLEADKTVVGINGSTPALVLAPSHGYSSGQLVKFTSLTGPKNLLGRTFAVSVIDVNSFQLVDQFNQPIDGSNLVLPTTGTVARVYTLGSPYAPDDLAELNVTQVRDLLRLTHYKYPVLDLKRLGPASWTLSQTFFSVQTPSPTGLVGTPSSAGTAGAVFTVTAVDHEGNESLPAQPIVDDDIINYSTTAGSYLLQWNPSQDVAYYNVYRSLIIHDGNYASRTQQLGYLGRALGAYFVDTNIIPDFTKLPPQYNDPFADGAILWINVTNGGAGYDQNTTLSIVDGTGSGAAAYPIVDLYGTIRGVVLVVRGYNYSASPTITAVGSGAGATFSAEVGSAGDNYPAVSTIFQQRQIYGGTLSNPLGLWGSRPRRFDNFDVSPIVIDSDSYEFEIDADKVSLIRHLFPMRGGLLIMNDIGVWQLTGGNTVAVTPTNALAEPQSYTGISKLTPMKVETDILYQESKGYTVRLLSYNDLSKLYGGSDISILSAHFFGQGKEIISWSFAQEPFKLVHACRADGYRLLGTIIKEQNIFAWTLASTRGFYRQTVTIREDNIDRVYLDVERIIGGTTVRYVELEASREFSKIEDAWCVDSGLALDATYPTAVVQFAQLSGDGTIAASEPIFTVDDVGKIIFGGGAKAEVTSYISPISLGVRMFRPVTQIIPETGVPAQLKPGEWSMDAPVTSISGLYHLENEVVSILADGSVLPPQIVENGTITFPTGVVRAIVGFGYRCVARSLPSTASGAVIEDKRKRVMGVASRIHEGRGLKTGVRLDKLYEFKDRTNELYGQPILPRSEMIYTTVEPEWDENGQFYYVVDDPLPVTVLGHVTSMEVGDDTD